MVELNDASSPSDSSLDNARPQVKTEIENVGGHTRRYRKVYGFFGFKKSYNFPLWIIFAGGMFAFTISRLQDWNYNERFAINIAPGYMYYFHAGSYRVGMILHLATALPAGITMVLQFTPIIRHKWIKFHRINGYFTLALLLVSNVAAFIVLPHNHSGNRIAAQTAEAILVIFTTIGIGMAWWNIRRLQIDQHRAWMLRTMFYYGTIITSRVFSEISSYIITRMGGYYSVWSCDEIDFLYKEFGLPEFPSERYPTCLDTNGGIIKDHWVAVEANRVDTAPEQAGTSSTAPFGNFLWFCIVLHIIGVEIYLRMTPAEGERLRRVSYEKQLAAGYKHAGSAGLTSDRWGDAEKWSPKQS